jgi:hypothetical protein
VCGGALLDEVLPSFGEHSQYLGVLFLAHIGETLVPKRGQGNVKGVHLVVLAGVARGEKTGSGRELGGYVHDPLSGGNQAQGYGVPQPSGTFHRPEQRSGKRLPQRTSERRPALLVEKTAYSQAAFRVRRWPRGRWWPCGDRRRSVPPC